MPSASVIVRVTGGGAAGIGGGAGRGVLAALRGGRTSGAARTLLIRRPRRHAGPLRILTRARRHARAAAGEPAATAADADRPSAVCGGRTPAGAARRARRPGAAARLPGRAPRRRARRRRARRTRPAGADAAGFGGAGRGTTRGGGVVGSGGVGVVGRCSSMRSRSVGGTTRPGVAGLGAAAAARRGGGAAATRFRRCGGVDGCGDRRRRLDGAFDGGGVGRLRPRVATCAAARLDDRRLDRRGRGFVDRLGDRLGFDRLGRRPARRLRGLDEARRRQHRRGRLGRLGRLLRRRAGFLPLTTGVSAKMSPLGSVMLRCLREALDELPRHDLFDRARRALHLDAVIALEQRGHFLARGAEQLRDLVNPNSCQRLPLSCMYVRALGALARIGVA